MILVNRQVSSSIFQGARGTVINLGLACGIPTLLVTLVPLGSPVTYIWRRHTQSSCLDVGAARQIRRGVFNMPQAYFVIYLIWNFKIYFWLE